MTKCVNCGADDLRREGEAWRCAYCRSLFHDPIPPANTAPQQVVIREVRYVHRTEDKLGVGLGCLCLFFFPLAWVIWALSLKSSPKRARTAFVIAVIQTGLFLLGILSDLLGRG